MKFVSLLRSTAFASSLVVALVSSCTNGTLSAGGSDGGAPPASAGATANLGGASTVSSGGSTVATGGASGCSNTATFLISDLEDQAQWKAWYTTHDATAGGAQTPTGPFTAQ